MCTYSFSINDEAVARIRPAFKDEASIEAWMLRQLERAIQMFEIPNSNKKRDIEISKEVAWFKENPVSITTADMDERAKYILER